MCVIPQNLIDSKLEAYGASTIAKIEKDKKRIIQTYMDATRAVPAFIVDDKGKDIAVTPEFHLFCGAPGTGKTTLARELVNTYPQNLSYKNEAHQFGIVAFDFDEILKQTELYRDMVGGYDENGLSQADERTRIAAYEFARNASLYISDSLVNAMFEGRRNFMYSIASSDMGAIKLAEGAKKAGYKLVVHTCEAPQHVYEQAVEDRFARGDRYTDPKDVVEKPAKARNNMIALLGLSERGHLYYRTEVDAGLKQVAVLTNNHTMIVESGQQDFNGYKAFVNSTGLDADTFIPQIRKAAGLDKEESVIAVMDMGFSPQRFGW